MEVVGCGEAGSYWWERR